MNAARALGLAFAYAAIPAAAFYAGWVLTGNWFRSSLEPFPFERYGLLVGLGCASWTLAAVSFVHWLVEKRRNRP